jgi:hypothetical protein
MINNKTYIYIFLSIAIIAVFFDMVYVSRMAQDEKTTQTECLNLFNIVSLMVLCAALYITSKLSDKPEIDPSLLNVIGKNGQPLKLVLNSDGKPLLNKQGKPVETVMDKDGNQMLDRFGKPYQPLLDYYGNPVMDTSDPSNPKPYEPVFTQSGRPVRPKFDSQKQVIKLSDGSIDFDSNGQALFRADGTQIQKMDAPKGMLEMGLRGTAAIGTYGLSEAAIAAAPHVKRSVGNDYKNAKESMMGKEKMNQKSEDESESEEESESESEDEKPKKKSNKSKNSKKKSKRSKKYESESEESENSDESSSGEESD